MITHDWLPAPIGIDAHRMVTRPGCRTVLSIAHTAVSCQRLLDVLEYVESDPRVQVVFTVAPSAFNHGLPHHLRGLGALVLPWAQATRERFDLALAAAYGDLHEVHAPLVLMPHGAGHGKPVPLGDRREPRRPDRTVYGLDPQRLTRDGRVLPAAMLLAHDGDRETLRRQCPEALPVASVVGDPCFDRLVASLPLRSRYRRALGIAAGQKLVVVASTWGPDGLFGSAPDLLPRLMDQLDPRRFRVGALLHPAVWSAHGRRQVRAWTRDCHEAGLILLDATEDWRTLVVAADHLIGDHGSVTAYAAAIGRPVLRLPPVRPDAPPSALADACGAPGTYLTTRGSAQRIVTTTAPQLDPDAPVLPQLRAARPLDGPAVTAAVTSRPGEADVLIRRTMYRLLELPEPGRHRRTTPVPVPGRTWCRA